MTNPRRQALAAGLLCTVFVMLCWAEDRWPLRHRVQARRTRVPLNVAIGLGAAITVAALEEPITRLVSRQVERRRWGTVPRLGLPRALETVLSLTLLDYSLYLWHVLLHRSPALWRWHRVHHDDQDLDTSTALRFHALEMLWSLPWRAAQAVVIGVSGETMKLWRQLTLAEVMFHHANLRLPEALDRAIGRLLVTPRQHGIHHSKEPDHQNANFSSGLALWDRLHGTDRRDVPQSQIVIGLPGHDADATAFAVRIARVAAVLALAGWAAGAASAATETRPWPSIVASARGQTVYWNAWAGDERTNAFIAWAGTEVKQRYGITVQQVKLTDTAEAVTRVVAERSAGRDTGGTVDLIWINGPNLLAMKSQNLLHGPFTQVLPNFRYVDTTRKRSNVIDFTVPVDGLAAPWRLAQFVFIYDSARYRLNDMPKSAPALLEWAQRHPGRVTHPTVRNFLGATFLKQALYDLINDPSVLQAPATDANFADVTAPLWVWYDKIRPSLWHGGRDFPESGPAQRQLMNDGEIDLLESFDPAEAAMSIANHLLPATARVYVMDKGTIGNTSFVAIPYNAAHKEAAMVVADFLLEPATQARAQDPAWGGNLTVHDLAKIPAEQRRLFAPKAGMPGLPTNESLGAPLLEPHPSWMTRIAAEWERRYSR